MIPPEEAAKKIAEWWNSLTVEVVTKKKPCDYCHGAGEAEVVTVTVKSQKS